jgi:hypothetical protein
MEWFKDLYSNSGRIFLSVSSIALCIIGRHEVGGAKKNVGHEQARQQKHRSVAPIFELKL